MFRKCPQPAGDLTQSRLPFWRLVRREVRATWWGRFRWLWVFLAVAVELAAFLMPPWNLAAVALEPVKEIGFSLLCAVAWLIPAWLGSDLFSTRFTGNTEPHREWAPREFLARAVGRLLPSFLVQAAWVGTFMVRTLMRDLATEPDPLVGDAFIETWDQFPGWFGPWIPAFTAVGLAYAAWAAWASCLTRRPRRALITLWVGGLGPLFVQLLFVGPRELSGFLSRLPTAPNVLPLLGGYLVGVESAMKLNEALAEIRLPGWSYEMADNIPQWGWLVAACFTLYAVPPFVATWWIAWRRCRLQRSGR